MKPQLTIVTRGVIYLIGLAVLSVCGILLPELAREEAVSNPSAGPTYPYLIGAWIISSPIFIALYQMHKLVEYLDTDKAFSLRAVNILQKIKWCVVSFILLCLTALVVIAVFTRLYHPEEDITFLFTFTFIGTFVSGTIAIFIAVLQKLLKDAIILKKENDLTV